MSLPTAKSAGQQPILVIEDEPSVIAFLRAALERKDMLWWTRIGCGGAGAAFEWQFAGVISDIRMPER